MTDSGSAPQVEAKTTQQFTKIPVTIEAYQFQRKMVEDRLFDNIPLPEPLRLGSADWHKTDRTISRYTVHIETLEGRLNVSEGDWIIKGVNGEFYPCKPDIFAKTYRAA